jgi:hypothetical protein
MPAPRDHQPMYAKYDVSPVNGNMSNSKHNVYNDNNVNHFNNPIEAVYSGPFQYIQLDLAAFWPANLNIQLTLAPSQIFGSIAIKRRSNSSNNKLTAQ